MSAFEPRFTINNAITTGLTTIERARGFVEAATLSDEWVIAREHGLNPRQALIVENLLENHEVRIEDVEALFPSVNRRSLQRDLQGLLQEGVTKSVGAGSAVCYKLKIKGL